MFGAASPHGVRSSARVPALDTPGGVERRLKGPSREGTAGTSRPLGGVDAGREQNPVNSACSPGRGGEAGDSEGPGSLWLPWEMQEAQWHLCSHSWGQRGMCFLFLVWLGMEKRHYFREQRCREGGSPAAASPDPSDPSPRPPLGDVSSIVLQAGH